MTHPKPATLLAQLTQHVDPATGGLVPPIQPSTTFARDADYALINPAHTYGRDDAPGYSLVEAVLRALEAGADALVFPSGMAAIAAVFRTLRRGEAIVAQRPIYYGTLAWLRKFCAQREIGLHDFDGADPASLERVVGGARPAIVWIETPSNPMLDVVDIARAAELAHAAGALLAVDSTAATPVLTRPLAIGADLVMHSATKYLNGHADVLAGALITRERPVAGDGAPDRGRARPKGGGDDRRSDGPRHGVPARACPRSPLRSAPCKRRSPDRHMAVLNSARVRWCRGLRSAK